MDQNPTGSRVGSMFGPYELRSLLGKGGMGEVYEAYDTGKDRTVALKLLSDTLARDPSYQERFRRESRAAARLQEPHVIPIHDWGEIDGVLYIDMRLVHGSDLRAVLRADGPLTPPRAVAVVGQIAAALDAAHADGLVHRDIKPENILITAEGFAYLVDFGIAHSSSDAQLTTQGSAIGSYAYMAPERFDVGAVDGAADTYSLACLLHECLTGQQPFPRGSLSQLIKSHLLSPPPQPSQISGAPTAFDAVIARGMAKQAQDRYRSTGDLARAAYAALGQRDQGAATAIVEQTTHNTGAGGGPIFQQTAVGPTLPQNSYGNQWQLSPPAQPPVQPVAPPFAGQPAQSSPLKPVLITLLAVLILGLGGAVAWVALADRSSGEVEATAGGGLDGGAVVAPVTPSAAPSPTAVPPSADPQTTTITTTVPAPASRTATPTRAPSTQNVGIANADGQGFVGVPNGRCNESDPAVAIAQTTKSYVVICDTGYGRYYYKGVRAADMAAIEIDDPVPTGSSFVATSNDGTRYQISQSYLTMTNGGNTLAQEPVVAFWSR